jgi:hypothetical protein
MSRQQDNGENGTSAEKIDNIYISSTANIIYRGSIVTPALLKALSDQMEAGVFSYLSFYKVVIELFPFRISFS